MYYMEPKTLIVVYKDELLVNQLKKLIETKDDGDENAVVGPPMVLCRLLHGQKRSGWSKRKPAISPQKFCSWETSREQISSCQ